ncbi:S1C family serine protease [Marinomonas mediterranea]|jgi:Trypsin-like serine proteases, typically periplasmic, contain C-terminal PDZ domain|uniref:HtrA2 peptidase n=1 Tax=Marinomonas mediterranea (strain ATCC 700492 / JCM 21426 / NBRC 103028 / MMB-1) TaxID=717774 RepID=F2K1B5_MARM1|nr:trypsin-like peptidase domain-containing protein [Marinomonas mediterranea]ADZ91046.1 HtrA2 peptidase [Marinomonas mediterranea MMB-1]WCN09083.1 trypsin-like serine protease [Marinomonas mediterranea]WCN13114.1 trypsin-like serine protease [Marinomonas mediterranea]WCN17185.1 trypsin-like serine protease [Marinomonas mediterranea MMB-1]
MKRQHYSHWVIYILAGICFGLATLLWQLKHTTEVDSYADAASQASPAVVNIYTSRTRSTPLSNQQRKTISSLGSGVIISSNGYILTNHHVVQGATDIIVALPSKRQLLGKLVGSDPATDLAVIRIDNSDLPTIPLGNSDKLRIGDKILAIGNPFGIGQTVTAGIISAKGRNTVGLNTYENFLQTDAAINPGNSGGALINMKGQLVGISSAIYSSSGGSQGIGFATPINDAVKIMNEIISSGKVIRGYLGIEVEQINSALASTFHLAAKKGLLITKVAPHSPAKKAGLEVGDVIININGNETIEAKTTQSYVGSLKPKDEITVIGIRGTQSYQTKIKLEEQPTLGT